ncbi:hypothetical protein ACHAXR_007505 [Thalassiosira sp. AJA248-18]
MSRQLSLANKSFFNNVNQEAAYNRLLSCYGIDPSTGNAADTNSNTKASHQNNRTHDLLEAAARLKDGFSVLEDAVETLSKKKTTKSEARRVVKTLKNTLAPLVDVAASVCDRSAQVVAPIAGNKYAHSRDDTNRTNALSSSGSKIEKINEFVKCGGSPSTSPTAAQTSQASDPSRSTRKKRNKLPSYIPELPEPKRGRHVGYGIGECVRIVSSLTKKGSRPRGGLIRNIIATKEPNSTKAKTPLVGKDYSTVSGYVKRFEEGATYGEFEEWPVVGRKAIMDESRCAECVAMIKSSPSEQLFKDDVNKMLVDTMKQKGLLPESDFKFNPTTLNNYKAYLAMKAGISLSDNSLVKTNSRWTQERSLIGAMSHVLVIAQTHFYVAAEEDLALRETLKRMPKEDRLFYDLMCFVHGNKPVRVRPPHCVVNSDDTTEFICKGIQPKKSKEIGLIAHSAFQSKSTLSIHHKEDSNKMNGQRIKRHLISAGTGDTAPPVICVAGLTEYEMPVEDFIVLEIEGLCVGGYGAHQSRGFGYLLFMRGGNGAERKRFRWIRENVLFPFINWLRLNYDDVDVDIGGIINEALKVVSWCDGDMSQLRTITTDEGIQAYKDMGVIACKHGAAATGSQQANDLCDEMPVNKALNKSTTVAHIPSSKHLLKKSTETAVNKLIKQGRLRLKKTDGLIDYVAKSARNLTLSCIPDRLVKGHVANGTLDPTEFAVPVFQKALATCKRVVTPADFQLCLFSFPTLFDYAYNQGQKLIPDSVFIEEHGFPVDIDGRGKEKVRDAGIKQEWMQRAKVLTGTDAIESRAAKDQAIEIEIQRKKDEKKATADQKRNEDQGYVDRLCTYAGLESSEANVAQCTLEHFAKLKAGELKAFIGARHKTLKKEDISTLKRPQGRKALEDAKAGVVNCVSVAYDVREEKSRLLTAATGDDDEQEDQNNNGDGDDYSPPTLTRVYLDPSNRGVKPSNILQDSTKIDLLCSIFDPQDKLVKVDFKTFTAARPYTEETTNLLCKADLLAPMLQTRFRSHIKRRVKPAQQEHWCLDFAMANLVVVAAYMVLVRHTKNDISCLDDSQCLLAKPDDNNMLLCTNIERTLYGCYLFFNDNIGAYVRSGSAASKDGFGGRLPQHDKRAKSDRNDDGSRLYQCYPSIESVRSNNRARKGYWEHLTAYIGASFGDDVVSTGLLSKDYDEGGIFFYSEEEKERINNTKFSGKVGEAKYMQMIAYLMELGYDVALSLMDNISGSPGFEGCGLIFDKKKRQGDNDDGEYDGSL